MLTRFALPLLHRLEPEQAHHATLLAIKLGLAPRQRSEDDPVLATDLFGRRLTNPIGLAAGFDKNAEVPDRMLALGFGYVEVGAVTPRPQAGNPQPRVFRLPEDGAVINRLGFNNLGLDVAVQRLRAREGRPGLVGVNLGANKDSSDRAADYVEGMRRLGRLVGFCTINVSSPNTPGLRALQSRAELDDLIARVIDARNAIGTSAPVALKIAPDLATDDLDDIASVALARKLDAIIVSNTTITRPAGLKGAFAHEIGGLSGRPLFALSTEVLRAMYRRVGTRVKLIGVGGISSGAEAYAKIKSGASAVQLYTALIYQGPGLVQQIKQELAAALRADGFDRIDDAVGIDLTERRPVHRP